MCRAKPRESNKENSLETMYQLLHLVRRLRPRRSYNLGFLASSLVRQPYIAAWYFPRQNGPHLEILIPVQSYLITPLPSFSQVYSSQFQPPSSTLFHPCTSNVERSGNTFFDLSGPPPHVQQAAAREIEPAS